MLLLAGLGNPGAGYAGHRHNMGFVAVNAIAGRNRFAPWRKKFQGEIAEGEIAGTRVLVLKPMTYMNLSGQSVAAALDFFELEPAALTVFHDEIDLLLGRVKVKTGGGHGGHNGIRDIMAHLGPDFRRVRLGVGHPGEKDLVHDHVLQEFAKAERELAGKVIEAVADEVPRLLAGDEGGFMSRVAYLVAPPKPKAPKPEPSQPAVSPSANIEEARLGPLPPKKPSIPDE